MVTGRSISQGIGQGEAQIFKQPDLGEKISDIAATQNKAREEKDKQIFGGIPGVKEPDIFIKHQPYFAQKNKEIWDFAKQNIDDLRKGDPAKTIQFNEMKFGLASDAGLSKQIKDSYVKVANELATNEDQYDDDAFDYLETYTGLTPEGGFAPLDPSRFTKRVNLLEDVQSMKSKLNVSQQQGFTEDPATGKVISYATETFTPKQAQELLVTNLQNPNIARQVQRDFNKLADTEKKKYANETDWYVKTFSPNLVRRDVRQTLSSAGDGDGYSDTEIQTAYRTPAKATAKESSDFRVPFTDTKVEEISSPGNLQFKKPISTEVTLATNMYQLDGTQVKQKGVAPITMASVRPVVVDKKTRKPLNDKEVAAIEAKAKTKGESAGKYLDYENVIPTKYSPAQDEVVSVFIPANSVKNQLVQNKIPYDKLEQERVKLAQERWGTTQQPATSKNANVTEAEYNALKPGEMYWYNGKQYPKK